MAISGAEPLGSGEEYPPFLTPEDLLEGEEAFRFSMYARLMGFRALDAAVMRASMADENLAPEIELDLFSVFVPRDEAVPVDHFQLLWRPVNGIESDRLDIDTAPDESLIEGIYVITIGFPSASVDVISSAGKQQQKTLLHDMYIQIGYEDGTIRRYHSSSQGIKQYKNSKSLKQRPDFETDYSLIRDQYEVTDIDYETPDLDVNTFNAILKQGRFHQQSA